MNLSGIAAKDISDLYSIKPNEFLICYDDFNISFGEMRFKLSGSSGGHNGMQSIIDVFGTTDIPRLRIGIGKPNKEPKDYVLSEFDNKEKMEQLIENGVNAIEIIINEDIQKAMSIINQRRVDE